MSQSETLKKEIIERKEIPGLEWILLHFPSHPTAFKEEFIELVKTGWVRSPTAEPEALKKEIIDLAKKNYEMLNYLKEVIDWGPTTYHPDALEILFGYYDMDEDEYQENYEPFDDSAVTDTYDVLEAVNSEVDKVMNDNDLDISSPNRIETLTHVKGRLLAIELALDKLESGISPIEGVYEEEEEEWDI